MKIIHVIKSLWLLLLSMKNPPQFLYKVSHAFERPVRYKLAQRIMLHNKNVSRIQSESELHIETYDGSGQACHPDCVFWKDQYWLVVTPYPYGMEEYENPCIYVSDDLITFTACGENPVATQGRVKRGTHLSDPFLLVYDDKLFCFYRKTEFDSDSETNSILLKEWNELTQQWIDNKMLYSSKTEELLSPVGWMDEKGLNLLFLNRSLDGSQMIAIIMDENMKVKERTEVICKNVPKGYYVWHFGFSSEKSETEKGVFLLRNRENKSEFMLYLGEYKNGECLLKAKFSVPKNIAIQTEFVYKSCFVPYTDKMILSIKDKMGRYCMFLV